METRIYITGTGGQGVMLIGKCFTTGAFLEKKNVLFVPSYGGEQRGGASNCAIMLSDGPIGAPSVKKYNIVVYMNQGCYDQSCGCVNQNGIAVLNSSFVKEEKDDGVKKIRVNAQETAAELGTEKAANIVMLGALTKAQSFIDPEFVLEAIKKKWEKSPKALELNEKAFAAGMEIAAKQL